MGECCTRAWKPLQPSHRAIFPPEPTNRDSEHHGHEFLFTMACQHPFAPHPPLLIGESGSSNWRLKEALRKPPDAPAPHPKRLQSGEFCVYHLWRLSA